MRLRIKQLVVTVILILTVTGVIYADDIMPLNQVKPGMIGFGKTVFQGTRVESFPIEVISIVEEQGLNGDLILIKTGGDKIDEIGGIAAGMSGSPVYIDGKLIGAIGYGWQFTDHHYGLVTPIERMLELIPSAKEKQNPELIKYQTPLYVSGMTGRAYDRLSQTFASIGLNTIPSGGIKETDQGKETAVIEPGSAIAVQLVRGDINVSSIGTLTYLDDDKILAFGHPFMNKGKSDYFLSTAYINGVIPSLQQPFKLGQPGDKLLGSITLDRGAGIAGKLNQFSRIVPLSVNIYDRDRKESELVNVQIIKDEKLLTSLAINVALQSIDSTLDRIGKGTAWVNYKITGNNLPDLSIENNNVYYSQNDIAALSLVDFYQLLNVITTNPFKEISPIKIQLDVEVENVDKVALVQEAKVLNKVIRPGDTLVMEVKLHPYRQDPFTKKVTFKLPEDIQTGMATVTLDGGFTGQSYQLPVSDEEATLDQNLNQAIVDGYKDFQSMLDDFLEQPKNNDLVIRIYPSYPVAQIGEPPMGVAVPAAEPDQPADPPAEEKPGDQKIDDKKTADEEMTEETKDPGEPEIKKSITTDYVLEGNLTLDIEITNPDSDEKSDKPAEKDKKAI